VDIPEISVTVHPPLRDMAENPERANAAVARDSAWALARTPGLEQSPAGDELGEILAPSTEPEEALDVAGLLRRLKHFFDGSEEVVTGTEQKDLEIGVYWIDVPTSPGSSGSLKVASQSEDTAGATLKIAGTGGGPSATVTISKTVSVDEAPVPQQAVITAPATFQRIELRRGNNVTTFVRLASIDWNKRRWQVGPLAPGSRPSTVGGQYVDGMDLKNASQGSTMELSHKVGTQWSTSIGLKLDQIGLDASVDVTGTYNQTVTLTYKLSPKYSYLAVEVPPTPGYWWTEP
jgi:hypothetical protein